MKILKAFGVFFGLLILTGIAFGLYLNRGLKYEIKPADFTCLDLANGQFVPFDTIPENIFGVGLAYAGHINETASDFDPQIDPPIFKKAIESRVADGAKVKMPTHQEIMRNLEILDPSISDKLDDFPNIPALLDYETEMGFVLLEDLDVEQLKNEKFAPKIGFFMANDLSVRSMAILGEGQSNRYDYWGLSKSFKGFTPMSDKVWVPNEFKANAIPCIAIETLVNDEQRQYQNTSDLIYTPLQMLQAIHRKYPNTSLKKGDLVLTGTPGGVAMSAPRWLMRLAGLIGMGRFEKLGHAITPDDAAKFLKEGDRVVVRGEGLGSVGITVAE